MADSSTHNDAPRGDVVIPDVNEVMGGDLVGSHPPAVGHEPAPHQENKSTDEESNLLEEIKESNLPEENKK